MAEAVGYAILGRIGENLVDPIGRQFGYLFCFNRNIQNLQTQHDVLKATREGVQLGVNEARNNVRIVEPLVEAWLIDANNKIAEAETTIESNAQVQKGCLKAWCWPRYSLSRKAAKTTQDLVRLHTEGIKYTQLSHSPPPPSIQSLPSTGFKGFESRNLIANQIFEALMDDEINLIGVCGMGGVGKTTLVKQVAKRVEEEKLFNKVAMAVVSQEPNLKQVQSCIAEMLGLRLDMENPIVRSSRLRERLIQSNEKILVILDDIWEEFDLEELGFPLEGGSNKSCKILFTSRNQNLWKGIQNKRYIQLQVLVGEEPWHLFREKVGDCADDLDLLPLAKQIVNECGGLPLALVTIGNALTNEYNQRLWNNALHQLRTPCSESLSSGLPAKVYQALYFSYNFLDERAKKLFLFCCLFPEDYDIPIEDLVRYGIGLRWFKGIDKVDEVRDRVNVLVDRLKSCYLLLDGCFEGQIKMQDVVRDVAVSIAAKDEQGFMTIHGAKSREWPKKATYELNTSISVISNEIVEFPGGLKCTKLEFLLIQCWNSSLKIPCNFFESMGELKVLDLTITKDISLLPSSLQFLSNLLTLHLDHRQKFDNMSVIGKLLNLEILSFRESNIEELPQEIGGLVKLKLLDLTRCYKLERIAPGIISALVQLQELYMGGCRIIWEREGKEGGENASLREFESLSNLNTLEITIKDVVCLPRIPLFNKLTKYAIFIGYDENDTFADEYRTRFRNFLGLSLYDTWTIPSECGGINFLLRSTAVLHLMGKGSEDVVRELFREGVEGFQHLKELVILDCATPECLVNTMGWVPRTPNAIPPIFPILESLELSNLPNLRKICHCQLPTGSFGKLKHLAINDCDRMEEVIWKEKGEDEATSKMEFPALESMTLKSLPMLIGFCRGTDEIEFPQLKSLPQLKSSNPFFPTRKIEKTLRKENHNATFLSLFSHKVAFPALKELLISEVPNITEIWGTQFPSERKANCFEKLMNIVQSNILPRLQNPRKLSENSKEKAMAQEKKRNDDAIVFPQLRIVRLDNLQNLKTFCRTRSSETQTLFNQQIACPKLRVLAIGWVPNITDVWDNKLLPTGSFCQLREVRIEGCDKLVNVILSNMLPQLQNLTELSVQYCPMVEEILLEKGEEKADAEAKENTILFPQLKSLELGSLENLKSFCTSRLAAQHFFKHPAAFAALEELHICNLPNITEIWGKQLLPVPKIDAQSFKQLAVVNATWCEKLVNVIPSSMFPRLKNLKSIYVKSCPEMEVIVSKKENATVNGDIICFPELSSLSIDKLYNLKSFCSSSPSSEAQPLFNDQVVFPILEDLFINRARNITNIWDKLHSRESFCFLKRMMIEDCEKLVNVVPSYMLPQLRNLEVLNAYSCLKMLAIVSEEEGKENDDENTILFPELTTLNLKSLDNLKTFHTQPFLNHQVALPKLKTLCLDQYLQQRLLKGKEFAIMNDDKEIEQDKQRLLKGKEHEITNENDDKETEQDKRRRLKGKEFRNYE